MPFVGKKCQKIRQFSSKKAFLAFFLGLMLAGRFNFANAKSELRNYKHKLLCCNTTSR